ncbi:MAG: glycogen/starch synthase, partial [Bacteroidales bacterium]|nr:glycogen/starch synthase [Bacteroidales bacterium]
MKILILNYEYPPLGGGAGVVSQYHAKGLAEKGHNVTVISTWYKGEAEIETKNNLKIVRL